MTRLRLLRPLPASGLRAGDEIDVADDTARAWLERGWAEEAKHIDRPPKTKALAGPRATK